jgi:hypothetical protein
MKKSKIELVKDLFSHIEYGNMDMVTECLSDDFMFSGPTQDPVDKKQFVELHSALRSALPDWSFNPVNVEEHDNVVTLKVHITGTHLREMNIPSLGIFSAPPSYKHISLPEEKVEVGFDGDLISSLNIEKVPSGGMQGILSQLGISQRETTRA